MAKNKLLLLFVRNPELGKVKTRLAATVGPEVALEVYLHLLRHTRQVTEGLPVDKLVYYVGGVNKDDIWPNDIYEKREQISGDLGQRMQAAFAAAFLEGYTSVVIIGSDCLQLTPEIIRRAYQELETHDVVIGPALDGGYYLIGMNCLYPQLFQDKRWSTEHVFPDTLEDVKRMRLSYALLPSLSDVDHAEDLDEEMLGNLGL
ncbi:TIGR04282 family arsenosugar biosynthesis glycosyltransferase [Pontibacter anaerobius]|uniref:TIGR04282 family arsenosugar biosynthesis glycosyltransferase n=1 Tax=Pontibacter anaerobius TaxID=2993940 RepID=A0ABT3RHG7_9BACT|nr:TIGR04282 family arsenosugar biosynthesis glycosyltransferase [Pontibacter anaerobius]MCX2741079.1 TIGR04282 family arsenosugar biosynthesis glycosyltransferase [Pontibacter anaerobius]